MRTRSKLLVPLPVGMLAAHQSGRRTKMMLRPSSKLAISIRAGADRRIRQRLGEIAAIEEVLRQHRHAAEDQRQLTVLVGLEVEHHAARALDHHVLHVRHLDPKLGRPFSISVL